MRWRALPAECLIFPSSSSFFGKLLSLVFFFLSPPCSVLFRSDFLALGAAERKGGGARIADGENLGKIALAFFASLCSLLDNFQRGLEVNH